MAQTPTLSEPSKTLSLPIGAASPLWLAFAGAASAGVAFWWMTRWTRAARGEAEAPAKLEPPVVEPLIIGTPTEIVAAAEPVAEMIAATPAPVLETVAEAIEPVAAPKAVKAEAPKPAAPKAAKPKLVEAKAPAVVLAKPKSSAKAASAPAKAKPAARKTTAKTPAKRD
jgi:hypothetical protein